MLPAVCSVSGWSPPPGQVGISYENNLHEGDADAGDDDDDRRARRFDADDDDDRQKECHPRAESGMAGINKQRIGFNRRRSEESPS